MQNDKNRNKKSKRKWKQIGNLFNNWSKASQALSVRLAYLMEIADDGMH